MGFFEKLMTDNQPLFITLCIVIIAVALAIILFTLFRRSKSIKSENEESTSPEDLIGKSGVVVERIDTDAGTGLVEIDGQGWAARTVYTDEVLEAGASVSVVAIEGVKLIVRAEA